MLDKENRLKKTVDFQRIYQNGAYTVARQMVIYYCPRDQAGLRVGFVASKKVGNSTRRNRCKRLLRESMRLLLPDLKRGYDVVVVARPPLGEETFSVTLRTMARLLRKARLLANKS
jgi:ribonuclease P protein component